LISTTAAAAAAPAAPAAAVAAAAADIFCLAGFGVNLPNFPKYVLKT
jgi:hypothetical protein